MTAHALAYVKRPAPGMCYWAIFCSCGTAPNLIGSITAHYVDRPCASAAVGVAHDADREIWTVRDIDSGHVEFSPSINTQVGPYPQWHHFHTPNPTGPVEVRAE